MIYQIFNKQLGAASLLMSLFLVSLIGMLSVYAAQVSTMEQKISINHLQSQQAFELAELGLELVINNLDQPFIKQPSNKSKYSTIHDLKNLDNSIIKTLVDSNSERGYFTFQVLQEPGSDYINITIQSFAADNPTVYPNQTLQQKVLFTPFLVQATHSPIIAKQNVLISNTQSTINNFSKHTSAAIWSGGKTLNRAKLLTSSSSAIYDQHQALTELGNEMFFSNFFSGSKSQSKLQSHHKIDCSAGCDTSSLRDRNNKPLSNIIWVDTYNTAEKDYHTLAIDQPIALGSKNDPVILIVDGRLSINHSAATITGLVYTTQSFINNGQGNVVGTLISEQDISLTGKMNFRYDEQVIQNLLNHNGAYTRIPGSWRDF